jgi:Na+-driven multidrug efflux pump
LFNLLITSGLVFLLYVFDRSALSWFLPADNRAVATAADINAHVAWTFILFGVTIVLFATVRATGAVTAPLVILIISILLVRTAFAYFFEPVLGAKAIWWSFAFGSVTSLALATGYYFLGDWRRARMLEQRPPGGEPPDTGLGLPRERAR